MHHISCGVFWWNISHPGDSAPLQPIFGALHLLAFPKIKITFEREEISDCQWGKYNGAADGNWENCVRSQGTYFEGDWGVIVLCIMFLVSRIFFNKYLYFSYYMAGYLLDRPCLSSTVVTVSYTFLIWFLQQPFRVISALPGPLCKWGNTELGEVKVQNTPLEDSTNIQTHFWLLKLSSYKLH